MKWTESAEAFFYNVIGDKHKSPYNLCFDIARAACERECLRRVMQQWPYTGQVEVRDVVSVVAWTGKIMSPEEVASWSGEIVP